MMAKSIPVYSLTGIGTDPASFQVIQLEKYKGYNSRIPHRHDYYEIFLFLQGAGYHEIDFEKYDVKKGSVHFVSPGQVHVLSRSVNSKGVVILFSREFFLLPLSNKEQLFDLPFLNNYFKPVINTSAGDFKSLIEVVELMKRETDIENEATADVIRSYLHILLLKCKKAYVDADKSKFGPNRTTTISTFRNFRILVEKHYRELHQVKEYAARMKITPENLNEISKSAFSKTASEVIADRIILEAKRLIRYSEHSAKEISYFLGFPDPSYFTKYFKSHTGQTPAQYKDNESD